MTALLAVLWLVALVPLVLGGLGPPLARRWGQRLVAWSLFGGQALVALAWGVALGMLLRQPEGARQALLNLGSWHYPGGLTIVCAGYLDPSSAWLGLAAASLVALGQAYALWKPQGPAFTWKLALLGAANVLFFLAGDALSLFTLWLALSWITSLLLANLRRARGLLALGLLSDGALALALMGVAALCGTTGLGTVGRCAEDQLIPNDPAALRIGGAALVAIGARLAALVVLLPSRVSDEQAPLMPALAPSLVLLPAAFYPLLRLASIYLAAPALAPLALGVAGGGAVVAALWWVLRHSPVWNNAVKAYAFASARLARLAGKALPGELFAVLALMVLAVAFLLLR